MFSFTKSLDQEKGRSSAALRFSATLKNENENTIGMILRNSNTNEPRRWLDLKFPKGNGGPSMLEPNMFGKPNNGVTSQASEPLNAIVAFKPPRVYKCNFCRREYSTPQALGGHQNAHKGERILAKMHNQIDYAAFTHSAPYPYNSYPSYNHSPPHPPRYSPVKRFLGVRVESMIHKPPLSSYPIGSGWWSRMGRAGIAHDQFNGSRNEGFNGKTPSSIFDFGNSNGVNNLGLQGSAALTNASNDKKLQIEVGQGEVDPKDDGALDLDLNLKL